LRDFGVTAYGKIHKKIKCSFTVHDARDKEFLTDTFDFECQSLQIDNLNILSALKTFGSGTFVT